MKNAIIAALMISSIILVESANAAPGVSSTKFQDLPAGDYVSDKAHTSLTVKLSHMGYSSYTLRFSKVQANFGFDPKAPEASKLTVTIDPASIDTGSDSFDKQLSGKGWLEASAYPTMTFVSTKVDVGDGVNGLVVGDLTLHGVTKPVTLNVKFNGVGGDIIPFVTRAGFSATAVIKRSDFGVTQYLGLVGDEMVLQVETEFTKKIL